MAKRLIIVLLSATLLITVFSIGSVNAEDNAATAANVKYDVNSDGEFNVNDVTYLQMYIAAFNVSLDVSKADCYADGKINIMDATYMQLLLAGKISDSNEGDDSITKDTQDIEDILDEIA